MTAKPVILRASARQDVDEAADFYALHADETTALRFVEALERACRDIAQSPRAGSQRYAHELDLPGLRFWPLRRHPYLVFYVECGDHIDVWRVLHAARDLPAWLQREME